MKQLITLAALALAVPALAAPGGPIGTLQPGDYVCELPGDATGPAGVRAPEQDFTVITASTYRTAQGRGSYLLTGDLLTMTSGPKKGQRFRRLSGSFLRLLDANGAESALRCVRRVNNNR